MPNANLDRTDAHDIGDEVSSKRIDQDYMYHLRVTDSLRNFMFARMHTLHTARGGYLRNTVEKQRKNDDGTPIIVSVDASVLDCDDLTSVAQVKGALVQGDTIASHLENHAKRRKWL